MFNVLPAQDLVLAKRLPTTYGLIMKALYYPYLLLLFIVLLSQTSLMGVSISNKAGKTINVEILEIETNRIFIHLENGNKVWLDLDRLSEESQQMIAELEIEPEPGLTFEAINSLLGLQFMKDNSLWDDKPGSVAERLGWPLESQTDNQSGYRYYTPEAYSVLGTRAYTCTLYGIEGVTDRVSIIFANKGDFPFSSEPTKAEIKSMKAAIESDEQALIARLSDVLGEPVRQSFGGSGSLRERIQRWDWNGHAFMLASQPGEYVSLRITSSENADRRGRGERFSDSTLRKLTASNVTKSENGDVLIRNIPMVDQGPKGYCVPATFERYLRYMQIPADMYILAMAGQTEIGGGTYLTKLIESVEGYLSSQNRSLKRMRETIDVRMIQKYVDDGLPIIWTMFSSREYNQYANQRTLTRRSVTDWDSWEKQLKKEERDLEFGKDLKAAHACMITGYNEITDEIAVSDSWGPEYEERWISVEHAQQVSQGFIYLISF